MNGIVGMSTLLDQTSLTKEQRHYLTTIRTCCDQLLEVANTALANPDQPTRDNPANHTNPANYTNPTSHTNPTDGPPPIPILAEQYPLHILLAEDNPINQQLALILLTKMGYSPDIAANGKEVLALLDESPYDLIFMDVQMPEMDGLEATRTIRTRPTRPTTPIVIIAMTANTTRQDREQCLASGMNDYLSKPINLTELTSMLKKWATQKKHP